MAKILTVSRKKTKILTVNRKSYHPIETLTTMSTCNVNVFSSDAFQALSTIG